MLFLLILVFSLPLPIKQPNKVDQHIISTPKAGVKDLVVTHYDCSQICSIISSVKLANIKSNQQIFKYSPPKCKYFLQI